MKFSDVSAVKNFSFSCPKQIWNRYAYWQKEFGRKMEFSKIKVPGEGKASQHDGQHRMCRFLREIGKIGKSGGYPEKGRYRHVSGKRRGPKPGGMRMMSAQGMKFHSISFCGPCPLKVIDQPIERLPRLSQTAFSFIRLLHIGMNEQCEKKRGHSGC